MENILIINQNFQYISELESVICSNKHDFIRLNETELGTPKAQELKKRKFKLLILTHYNESIVKKVNKCFQFNKLILISDKWKVIENLHEVPNLNIILGTDKNNRFRENEFSISVEKLLGNDIFGIGKYLLRPIESNCEEIEHPLKRWDSIEKAKACGAKANIKERVLDNLETCMNELVTNGFYHGDPSLNNKRDIIRQLRPICPVELSWGFNKEYFAFSVVDHFGRLDRDRYLRCIYERLHKPILNYKDSKQSFGMGFSISFKTLHSIVVNVCPNKKTELIGLIKLDLSRKELKEHFSTRSFLYFITEKMP